MGVRESWGRTTQFSNLALELLLPGKLSSETQEQEDMLQLGSGVTAASAQPPHPQAAAAWQTEQWGLAAAPHPHTATSPFYRSLFLPPPAISPAPLSP